MSYVNYSDELRHFGTLGMKWGIRRYQNPDGSLTPAGKKRYYKSDGTLTEAGKKRMSTMSAKEIHKEMKRNALEKEYEDSLKATKSYKPNVVKKGELSNAEMQAIIDRKKLEKDFYSATHVETGKEKFAKAMAKCAQDAAGEALKFAITTGGKAIVNKLINSALGSENNPNSNKGNNNNNNNNNK